MCCVTRRVKKKKNIIVNRIMECWHGGLSGVCGGDGDEGGVYDEMGLVRFSGWQTKL